MKDKNRATLLGLSIAGASAALNLSDVGWCVTLYEIEGDLALREQFQIQGTRLAQQAMRGLNFENLVRSVLTKSGVDIERGIFLRGTFDDDPRFLLNRAGREVEVKLERSSKLLYAPNGLPASGPILMQPNFSRALGHGLSMSASADAVSYRGGKAAVIGASRWAFEQARFAAEFASSVKVFSEKDDLPSDNAYLEQGIKFIGSTRLVDLKLSASGRVEAVMIETKGQPHVEGVDVVFLAPRIQTDWNQLGGEEAAHRLKSSGMVRMMGVANSIPYDAYPELEKDGIQVADVLAKGDR
jgi:thioredoxin reductase